MGTSPVPHPMTMSYFNRGGIMTCAKRQALAGRAIFKSHPHITGAMCREQMSKELEHQCGVSCWGHPTPSKWKRVRGWCESNPLWHWFDSYYETQQLIRPIKRGQARAAPQDALAAQ